MDQGTVLSANVSHAIEILMLCQGLLAVPFVLHSQPTAVFEENAQTVHQQASVAQRRYAEIMRDVEDIINDHSEFDLLR
jgi:IMP and pyridine-specific 5'-nucleotidase